MPPSLTPPRSNPPRQPRRSAQAEPGIAPHATPRPPQAEPGIAPHATPRPPQAEPRISPYATPHRFAPLTDPEFAALAPFLARPGPGRNLHKPRETLNALFAALLSNRPWSAQGPGADALARKFRRWAHAGLWTRLLTALPATPALKPLAYRICRAFRAAIRILGIPAIALARKLTLYTALPAPPWMLPDPILSESVTPLTLDAMKNPATLTPETIRALMRLHLDAGGRRTRRAMAPP